MPKIAIISIILETPEETQQAFNELIARYKAIVKGKMGLPFHEEGISLIAIAVCAEMDKINELTGKLGQLKNVTVKTAVSKVELS